MRRELTLTVILLLIICISHLTSVALSFLSSDQILIERAFLQTPKLSESFYARGLPFPLACADEYDLDLIPGISSALAQRLLNERKTLLGSIDVRERMHRLETIRGIAPKTVKIIGKYISLERQCTLN